MAAPGTSFETPRACPFVALELDRDRRSDKPDYRHRCFAEPTPAPRSIAHQEAYCLSPNFSACPVFQDWAVRAAARPASAGPPQPAEVVSGPAMVGASALAASRDDVPDHDHSVADVESEAVEAAPPDQQPESPPLTAAPANDPESAIEVLPEDASVTTAGAEIAAAAAAATGFASAPTFATTWDDDEREAEQLSAFDAPPPSYEETDDDLPHSSYGAPDAGYQEPPMSPPPAGAATGGAAAYSAPAFVPPPAPPMPLVPPPLGPEPPAAQDEEPGAVLPPFLEGRSSRPPAPSTQMSAPSLPPPRPKETSRDQIVPSWDIDGRYGAEGPPATESGGGRLDGVLTAIAVIAILALGVAAVLFLPGLLNGKKPATSPGASIAIPSLAASPGSSAHSSLGPTIAPTSAPSVAPTTAASVGPVATPRTYKIKPNDSLAKIANKFGVSVQDILDANPQITNPNNIIVGQIIVIPVAGQSP